MSRGACPSKVQGRASPAKRRGSAVVIAAVKNKQAQFDGLAGGAYGIRGNGVGRRLWQSGPWHPGTLGSGAPAIASRGKR